VCTSAELATATTSAIGDPTELALLEWARQTGVPLEPAEREAARRAVFHFDPHLKRMSTVDVEPEGTVAVHTKGAPETVLPSCTSILDFRGQRDLTAADRATLAEIIRPQRGTRPTLACHRPATP
jgi:magnesium-transporting ATPase (P-type)